MRRILSVFLILAFGSSQPAHALRAPEATEAGTEEMVVRSLRNSQSPPLSAGAEDKLAALVQVARDALSSTEEKARYQALTELPEKIRETLGTGSPAGDPRLAPFVPMLVKAAADEKESFDNRDIAIWILRYTIRRPEAIEGIGRALGVPEPSERIGDSALRDDLIDALTHTIAENEGQLKQIRWILRKILLKKKGEPDPEVREYAGKVQWEIDGIFWEAARLWKTSPKAAVKNRRQAFNGILLGLGSFDGKAPLYLARENFAWIFEKALRTEPNADQAFHLIVELTDELVERENASQVAEPERREELRTLFNSIRDRFKSSPRFNVVLDRRILPRLAPEALPTDPPLVLKANAGAEEKILSRIWTLRALAYHVAVAWLEHRGKESPAFPVMIRNIVESHPKVERRMKEAGLTLQDAYRLYFGKDQPPASAAVLSPEEEFLYALASLIFLSLAHRYEYGQSVSDEEILSDAISSEPILIQQAFRNTPAIQFDRLQAAGFIRRAKQIVGLPAAGAEELRVPVSRFRQLVNGPEVDAVVQAAMAEGEVVDIAEKVQGLLEAARGAGYEGKLLFIPTAALYKASLEPVPLRLFVQELHRPVIERNLRSARVSYQEDPNLKGLDFIIADFSFKERLNPEHAPLLEVDVASAKKVAPALLYYLAKYRPDLTRPGRVLVIGKLYTGDLGEGLLIFA